MTKVLIAEKLAGLSWAWEQVFKLLLSELQKQKNDCVAFWGIADGLGAEMDMFDEDGWNLVAATLEWVVMHGTPTEELVTPFLRKKKLIP